MTFNVKSTLFFAVTAIIITACGGEKTTGDKTDTTANIEVRKTGELKIAFYSQDSLFLHFEYYLERDSVMTAKGLAFQKQLQKKSEELENYISSKDQQARQGLLSEVEVMQAQQTIQQRQAELMRFQEEQGGKIEQETVKELEAIGNKIKVFGQQYAEENGIDILLVKAEGGQINYIHSSMDVTKEFTEYLNQKQAELEAEINE